jgi:hypothetical protein
MSSARAASAIVLAIAIALGGASCSDDDEPQGTGGGAGTTGADAGGFGTSACAACTRASCSADVDACSGEPDCNAWLECVDGCPVGASGNVEPGCESACPDATSSNGQTAQAALENCTAQNLPGCSACGAAPDGGGGGTGIAELDQSCPASDETDACYACWDTHCCDTEAACAASADCQATQDCTSACASGDWMCLQACFQANPKGAVEIQQRLVCRFAYCATGATCLDEDVEAINCSNQYCMVVRTKCWLIPECYLISVCAGSCSGSPTPAACIDECKAAQPASAVQALEAFTDCSIANC